MNTITDLVNTTASGSISATSDIMAWPIGYMVYFVVGIGLLWFVVFTIKKWF